MATRPLAAGKPEPDESGYRVRARIGATVLGEPADFHAVQVRPFWPGRYRVNVLVGGSAVGATVAHSYFLEAVADRALARRF